MARPIKTFHQRQTWHDFTRYLIATNGASIQLDLYPQKMRFGEWNGGGTAFIYALWVIEGYRKRGHATALLNKAEETAREAGHKSVFLEWASKDTPVEILEWYKRRGYCESEGVIDDNGEEIILLEKKL